ncbi:MAG TPA: malto-oligosyltrehalose synthase [Candidatus Binatia bacterium]|nr:malto-oligosyltrehalose synthase [Candidatus Binatia bacterium]
MKPGLHIPRATYRLQLNRDFTFSQASEIVPYLSELGVSHCYLSPCLKARPGSMHGYDIVDHNSFNPEIGTAEDFDALVAALHAHGMGVIMDIVPNHMGVMGADNAWWLDVLENGEASIYASFFDIDWHPLKEELQSKVLIPVLSDHYGVVLENGDLKLTFDATRGEFSIFYQVHRFPVNPRQYPAILQHCVATITEKLGEQNQDVLEFQSLITAFGHLPVRQEITPEQIAERNRDKEIHKRRLAELCARRPEIVACIESALRKMNGTPGDPSSFEDLHELVKAQAYRLANWRVAADDINYRRFFDTNDLAGICMENESVFEATHRLVLKLISEGKVNGLRLDHPDGLYNPAQYFERLKRGIAAAVGEPANEKECSEPGYVAIEKILLGQEKLPENWAICGTTGYEFANLVNGLFVDASALMRMERLYRSFTKETLDYRELAYRCRKLIMQVTLASELNVLANRLARIALSRRRTCDFTLNSLSDALTEIVAAFPVYRTYVSGEGVSHNDAQNIGMAIALAKWRSTAADTSIFDFIHEVLLTRIAEGQNPAYKDAVTTFAMKFQQFTGPVMAKGVEDTAFYRYNRLLSLDEVGSDLRKFGVTPSEFHAANQERLQSWPHTMLATSTHDTKRSEDVRARIDVLSEIPGLWRLRVRDWHRFNSSHRTTVNERHAPSHNDEYALYQTLLGAWPLDLNEQSNKEAWESFSCRIEEYMLKVVREAKQHTSWVNRNAEYEDAVSSFVKAVLSPGPENRFLGDFIPLQRRVARMGVWNSLSQTLLKLTSPGVPDIYQGNEVWDLSLVDPDNRRPVDYGRRRQVLDCVKGCRDGAGASPAQMLETPEDGRLKMFVTWKALAVRRERADLFREGEYLPLTVRGTKAAHVVAFARKLGGQIALVAAPRLIGGLVFDGDLPPIGPQIWGDTHIVWNLNEGQRVYNSVLSGAPLTVTAEIPVAQLLSDFPAALCLSTP